MKKRFLKTVISSVLIASAAHTFYACSGNESLTPFAPQPEKSDTADFITTLALNGEVVIPEDQLKALAFNTATPLPKLLEAGSTWDTHTFFRKKGASFVGYALITWTVGARDSQGRITLKQKNTNVTIQNTNGDIPNFGEEWYVAGVAGGGVLRADKTSVDFTYSASVDDQLLATNKIRLPLTFPWTKLNIDTKDFAKASLTFTPQGTLIHVHTINKTTQPVTYSTTISSNAIDRDGFFNYSVAANDYTAKVVARQAAVWQHTNTGVVAKSYKIKVNNVASNQTGHALIWGMPKSGVTVSNASTQVVNSTSGLDYKAYNRNTMLPVNSNRVFQGNKAYYVYIDIQGPNTKLPLEYMADRNIQAGANSNTTVQFVTTDANTGNNMGFYTHGATRSFLTPTIGGVAYHIPNVSEIRSVFGTSDRSVILFNSSSGNALNNTEVVQVKQLSGTVYADYKYAANITYGLRYKRSTTSKDYTHLTSAWRYSAEDNPVGGGKRVVIKAVRLGSAFSGDINTISNETWWNQATNVITKIIPMTGYKHPNSVHSELNLGTNFTTTDSSLLGILAASGIHYGGLNTNYHIVRLFSNE